MRYTTVPVINLRYQFSKIGSGLSICKMLVKRLNHTHTKFRSTLKFCRLKLFAFERANYIFYFWVAGRVEKFFEIWLAQRVGKRRKKFVNRGGRLFWYPGIAIIFLIIANINLKLKLSEAVILLLESFSCRCALTPCWWKQKSLFTITIGVSITDKFA